MHLIHNGSTLLDILKHDGKVLVYVFKNNELYDRKICGRIILIWLWRFTRMDLYEIVLQCFIAQRKVDMDY